MDNASLQRIQEAVQRSKSIAVAIGRNPSIDEMGAALALFLSLQSMGKITSVVSPTEPIVELSNLVGIDKVKTRYEGEGADLVVSFPYREGEIEKVSYTIEDGYLNIVVKAGDQGLNFSEQEVRYTRGNSGGQLDLLFVVGTPRLSDIHDVFSPEILKNVTVINIDNKQENQGYGDIVLVSPRFSSVSEQMTQTLSDLRTPVDNDIAQNLLDGILFATENFQSSKTSYLALEMAGVLMRQGAVRSSEGKQFTGPQRQDHSQTPQHQRRAQQAQQPQDKRRHFDQRKPQQRPQQHSQGYQPQRQNQPQQGQRQPAQPQQQHRPQQQPSSQQPQPEPQQQNGQDLNPPTDWLTPKVYKGSSNV